MSLTLCGERHLNVPISTKVISTLRCIRVCVAHKYVSLISMCVHVCVCAFDETIRIQSDKSAPQGWALHAYINITHTHTNQPIMTTSLVDRRCWGIRAKTGIVLCIRRRCGQGMQLGAMQLRVHLQWNCRCILRCESELMGAVRNLWEIGMSCLCWKWLTCYSKIRTNGIAVVLLCPKQNVWSKQNSNEFANRIFNYTYYLWFIKIRVHQTTRLLNLFAFRIIIAATNI